MIEVGEIIAYCDERARRLAEAAARTTDAEAKAVNRGRMREAMVIGEYVARRDRQ